MTHTYESLRAKICEEIPEILDLTFGCRIQIGEDGAYDLFVKKTVDGYVLATTGTWVDGDPKILGREITLADVLRVIDKDGLVVTTDGNFVQIYDKVSGGKACNDSEVVWNLSQPLSGQSQEVLDFIGKLIINK